MLKTSVKWYEDIKHEVMILDPDGWDRSPDGWEQSWEQELITKEEFNRRLCQSTIQWKIPKL